MVQRSPFTNGPGSGSESGEAGAAASGAADSGATHRDIVVGRSVGAPVGLADRTPTPFVWQHGRQLLLLDEEPAGWVMAELRFEPDLCRYVEVRRATYDWAREAIGAVLSRALASGIAATEESARTLNEWLARYHGFPATLKPAAPDGGPAEFVR